MDKSDHASEYLRLAEHYRQMSDEELQELIPQSTDLTNMAQDALAGELRHRGMKPEVKPDATTSPKPSFDTPKFRQRLASAPLPADDSAESDAEYDEDRQLVELCTVWSQRDALKIQRILDVAGIPFFMGPEKATRVDRVASKFANGVSVQIMQIAMQWAGPLLKDYEPEDDPTPKESEDEEHPIRCPKCHSTEIIFDQLVPETGNAVPNSAPKFEWTCDSCGNIWQDDGVAKEG
jgi:DNA-directed RNA polymerase subunit M/transcription elongation factor TFIIS